jgi:hypothetical protein
MAIFICILLALAVMAYVLFVEPEITPVSAVDEQLTPLLRKKEILYENLRDLNFEYRMDKLSEADYLEAKRSSQAELVPVLSAIEELQAKKMYEETIPPPGWCMRCAHQNPAENMFCGACGATLKKKKR